MSRTSVRRSISTLRACGRGVLLLEVAVAMSITALMLGAALTFTVAAHRVMLREPDAADLQQRVREGFARVYADALAAGAGPDGLPSLSLQDLRAAVLPYVFGRTGTPAVDARSVTFLSVPPQARPLASIRTPLMSEVGVVVIDSGVACPSANSLCGFDAEGVVLITDDVGHSDLFRVLDANGGALRLQRLMAGPPRAFPAGSHIAPIELHAYYHDAARRQLRHYDGWAADFPVIDDVVDFTVALYGLREPRPVPGVPAATCLTDPAFGPLPAQAPVIELPATMLSDGPWCDHAGARYDVDLHRVVRLGVTLRLQVAGWFLRGPDAAAFEASGRSLRAGLMVPDYEVSFEISPRNLN